jgi:hypothetical protein
MSTQTLLLPSLSRLAAISTLPHLLGRGDREPDQAPGLLAALAEVFAVPGAGLPVAALLREAQARDAGESVWLCADPAWVQVKLAGARLLACGALGLTRDEAEDLARPLRPLLGDAGMLLETSTPDRWQLRLPVGSPLPAFAAPETVLGEHLLTHLPQGIEGRRWRALFTELQVLLHQHPRNRARAQQGLPPVNALWLWGGGTLPSRPRTTLSGLLSADPLTRALAQHARVTICSDMAQLHGLGNTWVDLAAHTPPDVQYLLESAMRKLRRGDALRLAFVDGARWRITTVQRWRFWRRAWRP